MNFPENFTFSQEDVANLPGGCLLKVGCQKSIRFLEGKWENGFFFKLKFIILGPSGRDYVNCGVVVENKKTPFRKCFFLMKN